MSNPEKRDERSMSDILASIRKIMAQEPAEAAPPSLTRSSLNGVSGAALDLPRTPELKLPPQMGEPQSATVRPAPTPAVEAVSLDELLAETPRAPPAVTPAKPAAAEAAPQAAEAKPAPNGSAQAKEASVVPSAKPAGDVQQPGLASKAQAAEVPTPAKEPPAPVVVGPPAPKLDDLGSVVPGKLDTVGPAPNREAGPSPSVDDTRPVLGPPLAGPLLGEPTRVPLASEPIPEVPGADALRRLIAGVIPPSAHPSLAPAAKEPEPAPATARAGDGPASNAKSDIKPDIKPDNGAKPVPEAKVETKLAPAAPPPAAKKPDVPTPAPVSTPAAAAAPKPAAAAPAPVATPAPKPAAPTPAATTEVQVKPPAAKPPAPAGAKTMDETVVELLRPLLREWLNTNMPRLIEPALRAELEALRSAVAKDKKG